MEQSQIQTSCKNRKMGTEIAAIQVAEHYVNFLVDYAVLKSLAVAANQAERKKGHVFVDVIQSQKQNMVSEKFHPDQ